MIPELAPYWALMEAFVQDRLRPSEFEILYLRLFKNDPTMWPQEVFDILNRLFADVDAYSPDPSLRRPNDLDQDQLRDHTREAMRKLQEAIQDA